MHMISEISQEIEESRDSSVLPAWLRRTLVFLLLGPTLGVFGVLLTAVLYGGMDPFLGLIVAAVFVFGMQVAAVTAFADGMLSRSVPISLRAPLTAVTAAMVAIGSLSAMFGSLPHEWARDPATSRACQSSLSFCSWSPRSPDQLTEF